jgi:hypothetical protein
MLNISKYHKLIVGCSAIATAAVSGFVPSAEAAGQLQHQAVRSNPSTTLIAGNDSNAGSVNNSNSTGSTTPPGIIVKGGDYGPYYFDSNNGGIVNSGGYYYDPNGPKGPGYYPYTGQGNAPYYFGKGPLGLGYYSYNVNAPTTPPVVGPPGVIVKGGDYGPYYFDSNNGGVVANGGYYYDPSGPNGAGYYPYTGKGNAPYYFGKGPNGLGYYSYNVNAPTTPPVVGPPGITVTGGEFGPYYFDSNNGGVVANGGYYYDANGPKGPGYYPYTGQGNAPYYFGKGPNGFGYYSYNVNATTPPAGPPGVFVKGPNGGYYYYFDSNNGGVVANGGYYYDANGPKGPGYYPYTGQGNAPYYFGKGPNGFGYYSYNVNATTSPAGPPGVFVKGPNGDYYFDSNNGNSVPNGGYYYDANGPKGPGYYPFTGSGNAPYYFGNGPKGLGYYSYNVNVVNGSDSGAIGSAPGLPGSTGRPALIGPNGRAFGGGGYSSSQIAQSQALGSRISIASGKYDIALAALAAAEAAQPSASSKTSPVRYGREVADASTCGCLNTDTASAGDMSKQLIAAKEAEAAAAAELAAAKAEARQFLESVKGSESGGFIPYQPIW